MNLPTETLENVCALASRCNKAGTGECNILCSPFMLTHGVNGDGGYWKGRNVPKKYEKSYLHNLPIQQENPIPYEWVKRYVSNVLANVENGIGLFFYSIPNANNPFGTGTGKTTAATAILNEYVVERMIEHSKGGKPVDKQPALFFKASEFQNLYNAQFRGTPDMQDKASRKYYRVKKLLSEVELLVFDDIGIRQKITDAFENELTEVIDSRDSGELATIYTSNLPVEKLAETLGERIASRIRGTCEPIAFKGQDHRRKGIL